MLTNRIYKFALTSYLLILAPFAAGRTASAMFCDPSGRVDICNEMGRAYSGCSDPTHCSGCVCEGIILPNVGCS